ncbi:hypothetical protein SS50377_28604 [Spironucleus salmonicida]|uniref:Uncharacterized protein n=1 Tax=Spironucleus salmonicida TaxID=348837 RepID=A0A9P8LKC2_9EUKA|nr:hypothetical protein SS50377_28604 [Spironucleus salmonicida]
MPPFKLIQQRDNEPQIEHFSPNLLTQVIQVVQRTDPTIVFYWNSRMLTRYPRPSYTAAVIDNSLIGMQPCTH